MGLSILGADYAWSHPSTAGLKADGVKFVMRYLSHDPAKNLQPAELVKLRAAGLGVGLVWETTAGRALAGKAGGTADATLARNQAAALGLKELPIYFAVDYDAGDADKPTIAEYLRGAASVLGGAHQVGVYGGYQPWARRAMSRSGKSSAAMRAWVSATS